ncbi:hypothetical protein [Membranihabitans marinus]|uniref:hypothetical protein n=1 Tax=Membranihabitans marinus TaxID=1227546 RepID=UPI001F187EAE|nr:hypothetical protein [Membranihabitans marinus]
MANCLQCGKILIGRADKKYCDADCRSTYNNQLNRSQNNLVRQINRILGRNRRILKSLNPTGKTRVHRKTLLKAKFDFNYFTNIYKTQKGHIYYFCYDQGYILLENDYCALVERQDYVQ